jgi:hypothetical protein
MIFPLLDTGGRKELTFTLNLSRRAPENNLSMMLVNEHNHPQRNRRSLRVSRHRLGRVAGAWNKLG